MRLYSWNVNGVRAIAKKGFLDWLGREQPDVLCLQETKAHEGDLPPALREPPGYTSLWNPAKRKGYSGTGVYLRTGCEPLEVKTLGKAEFDDEGRAQLLEYPDFVLLNAYFPNSQPERKRLAYKLAFNDAVRRACNRIVRAGKGVIVCGDFNVSHEEIDLARPKANVNNPGFYIEERESMTKFLKAGYVDVFRDRHPGEPGHYTWWSYRAGARARNVGWRLDYHCVNRDFLPRVAGAHIRHDVMGSDHCPVVLELRG